MANERVGRVESFDEQATVMHADGSNEVIHYKELELQVQ